MLVCCFFKLIIVVLSFLNQTVLFFCLLRYHIHYTKLLSELLLGNALLHELHYSLNEVKTFSLDYLTIQGI